MTGDELDDLIDQGLRDYGAREPELGMESRVLRWVHRRESRLRFAIAAAACILLGVFTARDWQRPIQKLTVKPLSARIEVPPLTRVQVVRHKPRITAGERALLRFVQGHPEQAVKVFARLDKPITVDDIEIAPLAIEPLESQEEKQK